MKHYLNMLYPFFRLSKSLTMNKKMPGQRQLSERLSLFIFSKEKKMLIKHKTVADTAVKIP